MAEIEEGHVYEVETPHKTEAEKEMDVARAAALGIINDPEIDQLIVFAHKPNKDVRRLVMSGTEFLAVAGASLLFSAGKNVAP